jgi:surfeit locus 1 family protein
MKRVPPVATIIVIAACATMIGLGIWQLRRAAWKHSLIEIYAAARRLPPMAYPATPDPNALPLFRRASGQCLSVAEWETTSGRNIRGESGWVHIARCATGAEGPGISVVAGWSKLTKSPEWRGGIVSGIVASDPDTLIRLVSDKPLAPGLAPAAPPDIAEIPNNHFAYAVQWFLFAAAAGVIYLLALRRRAKP